MPGPMMMVMMMVMMMKILVGVAPQQRHEAW
jgi:hypothetical protein